MRVGGGPVFWTFKRVFDFYVSALGLPLVGLIALGLILVNPFFNRGPVFFFQKRMGRNGRPFTAVKFRTMLPAAAPTRSFADPVEHHRITPLGRLLRRTRIDELPQFWNVLAGEMSLIGPRPDVFEHAVAFARLVPGYRARYIIRPGISGYAQVRMGYVEGAEMTRVKTRKDLVYIRNAGWRIELSVLRRTFGVMASGFGAK